MTFKEIETSYRRLTADGKRLDLLRSGVSVCDVGVFETLEQMKQSNVDARQELYLLARRKFPKLPSDLENSEADLDELVSLLKHYPSFINGNEMALSSLFWLLCSNEACRYKGYIRELLPIMRNRRIKKFVACSGNDSVRSALDFAIKKASILLSDKYQLYLKQD